MGDPVPGFSNIQPVDPLIHLIHFIFLDWKCVQKNEN
jgi:hypothetical protein